MVHIQGPARTKRIFRLVLIAICLFSLVCMPVQAGYAQGGNPPSNVPAGQTVEDELFLYGTQVTVDGNVDGDVMAIGQDVTINGEVSGSLITAGWGKIIINGKVTGSVYAAGSVFELGPAGMIQRSLYLVSGLVTLKPGSQIGRDFSVLSLSAELAGNVGRDSRAVIGIPSVFNFLFVQSGLLNSSQGWLNNVRQRLQKTPAPSPVPLAPTSTPTSSLLETGLSGHAANLSSHASSFSKANLGALGGAVAPFLPAILQQSTGPSASIDWQQVGDWLLARLRELIPLLLIGLLMIWKSPDFLKRASDRVKQSPFTSAGLGFVGYITGFAAIIFILLIIVAVGAFFAYLTFWNMAWLTWGVGLGFWGIACALFALAIGYLSQVIVSFLLGELLLYKLTPDLKGRRFWSLLLGSLIYLILHSIPILGIVVSLLVMFAGFGAILFYLSAMRAQKTQPALESSSTEDSPTSQAVV